MLDEMSVTHPSVIFLKVDGDKAREVSSKYQVEGFPTILLIRDEKVIDKVVGYAPEEIESKIEGKSELEMDLVFV